MNSTKKRQIKEHGLAMMDRAITARFGVVCDTRYNEETRQYETGFAGEPDPAVLVFIAGYQKALVDMFIAARL